jgi:hypothetical protein
VITNDLPSSAEAELSQTRIGSPNATTAKLLDTNEAAAWLTARGIKRTPKTLEVQRVRGGPMAPPFRKVGRAVRYAESDLTGWLAEITSPAFHSTTQAKAGGVA